MSKLLQRLRDPARSGVYRATGAQAVLDATRASDLDVVFIDARDKPLDSIARDLAFPDWFGRNWDALEDSLGDLSWREGAGHVLVFSAYPQGRDLEVLLDVLRSSAEYWAGQRKPFFGVMVDPSRQLQLPDLYRDA